MICYTQGGYESHSQSYHKGQAKGTSDTVTSSWLCAPIHCSLWPERKAVCFVILFEST